MKIKDIITEKDLFGVETPSPEQVAQKHKVPLTQIQIQLAKGISVEIEHTKDKALAREIALDHLAELPDYYDRLNKMEKQKSS